MIHSPEQKSHVSDVLVLHLASLLIDKLAQAHENLGYGQTSPSKGSRGGRSFIGNPFLMSSATPDDRPRGRRSVWLQVRKKQTNLRMILVHSNGRRLPPVARRDMVSRPPVVSSPCRGCHKCLQSPYVLSLFRAACARLHIMHSDRYYSIAHGHARTS